MNADETSSYVEVVYMGCTRRTRGGKGGVKIRKLGLMWGWFMPTNPFGI